MHIIICILLRFKIKLSIHIHTKILSIFEKKSKCCLLSIADNLKLKEFISEMFSPHRKLKMSNKYSSDCME